jgi:hypothetical protein
MNKIAWSAGMVIAGCLGIFAWQRQTSRRLHEVHATQQQRQDERTELLAKNRALQAGAISAEELDRLRAEHDAIARLRGEVAAVKNRPPPPLGKGQEDGAKTKAEATLTTDLIAASEWKNAGRATPVAATETFLWAAAGGDIDILAAMLNLPPATRSKADAILAQLAPELREQYGTPERLIALLTARDVPLGKAGILNEPSETAEGVSAVVLKVQTPEGLSRTFPLVMRRGNDGWQVYVPSQVVENYGAKLLGQPLPYPERPWKP